jgi:hypothetical protein
MLKIENRVHIFLEVLNCQRDGLPFTYLGLPLSTTKPRKAFFMPLHSAQRRLSSYSMYLKYGDKLRLVNSVLSYCTLELYQWILKELDKYMIHCIWRKRDLDEKSYPLAA